MVLEDPDKLNGLGLNAAKSLIDFAMKVQQWNFQGRLDRLEAMLEERNNVNS